MLMKEPMCTHLFKVPGSASYYFRRKIPADLVAHYKKQEIKKSLRTSDRREAERLARQEGIKWDEEFLAVRNSSTQKPTDKQEPDYQAYLLPNGDLDIDKLRASMIESGDWMKAINMVSHHTASRLPRSKNKKDVAALSFNFLKVTRARRDLVAGTPFYEKFMASIRSELEMREEILMTGNPSLFHPSNESLWGTEALRNAYRAFLNGDGIATFIEPIASSNTPISQTQAEEKEAQSVSLLTIIDKWAEERKPNPKTANMANLTVKRFRELIGKQSLSEITRHHVVQFKDKLLESGQSSENTNKQLSMINTLLNYAVNNAMIDSNPATGITIKITKTQKARISFDSTALNSIFHSPVFTDGLRPKAGAGNASFWIPLLALFTGARIEELGQLHPSDVTQEAYQDEQGQSCKAWVIRIKASQEHGQSLKNEGSNRRIPVHTELIRLGFLDLAQAAQANNKRRIFDKLVADKFGTETAQFSKWFGRYLRKDCKVTNTRMTFHSFRHTFKELCRLAEISVGDALTGHVSGNVGDKYGGDTYPLRPLVNGINQFKVPNLDLSGVSESPPPSTRA
jgi:integrase